MNPQLRYFLPSQVRGVYRFDDALSQIDSESYPDFVKSKLRFLPVSLIEKISRHINLSDDFKTASQRLFLNSPRGNRGQHADIFFSRHPYFANALQGESAIKTAENFLEIHFVKKILAPLLNDEGLASVHPQKQIGRYCVDFAIGGPAKLALEVDGFGKFQHREDLDSFIERQNFITSQGWRMLRFTYGQIMRTTKMTLKTLHDFLAGDPNLRGYVFDRGNHSNHGQMNLFDEVQQPAQTAPTVFNVVNDFYRIQDWFADLACSHEGNNSSFLLQDDFGWHFPMVALSLSSLYHFLDMVMAIVDVEFDLPSIKVQTPEKFSAWIECLHPKITMVLFVPEWNQTTQAIIVNPDIVQCCSASLPVPVPSLEKFSFRKDLSFEAIHRHLDYISHEFFGYNDGTKSFQDKVLQRVFDGKEVLGISATGSGKSFCYWLPSLLKPGLTLVISPLRSLMRDQRLSLLNYGNASMEFINSDVDATDQRRYMQEAKLGYLRILYISPERLRIKKFVEEIMALQHCVPINVIAIDEAHCISEWGHDFRPSYLKLPWMRQELAKQNPDLRLISLTATAGQQVEKDMRNILKLSETDVIRDPVADRERFSFQIVSVGDGRSKTDAFHQILQRDLPKALKQPFLQHLLSQKNGRNEKAVGLVFCIYADSHGENTVKDGTTHYLFETMRILEPDNIFVSRRGRWPKYDLDAFSSGKVRAFASKPPTLCPKCLSYKYTSQGNTPINPTDYDDELDNVDAGGGLPARIAGQKTCLRCGNNFPADEAAPFKPKEWEKIIEANQIDFRDSAFDILVATKGFGMGIDKSSVRFVIHTSLSSGIESWYQEVGRAGRDNERAHIVLIADPPNDSCKKELGKIDGAKRPQCSWSGGCKHGRESICDYGKQHIFITRSYPGAETDAIYALKILDRLLTDYSQMHGEAISIRFNYTDDISRREIALYRLMTLGLVEDYTVAYGQRPCFEVELRMDGLPDTVEDIIFWKEKMQDSLIAYMSHWDDLKGKQYLEVKTKGFATPQQQLLFINTVYEHLFSKTKDFKTLPRLPLFFNAVYDYLLLLLDHVYKDIVKMRYDMLWNLLSVTNSEQENQCQRVKILKHFENADSVDNDYKCGCCNACSPTLDFLDRVNPRIQNLSLESSRLELNELLNHNELDIDKLRELCVVFRDYSIGEYAGARAILEGSPNNLPALYLTREFSPQAELEANTRRLLRTANDRGLPLAQLRELYETSGSQFKPALLLILNDEYRTSDTPEGWEFLIEEAKNWQHSNNIQIAALHDCLDFFVLVDEMIPADTEYFRERVETMEEILNA